MPSDTTAITGDRCGAAISDLVLDSVTEVGMVSQDQRETGFEPAASTVAALRTS
jgi:hypothetical protein